MSRNELRKRVLAANHDLKIDTLAFSCAGHGRLLQEISVCYEKNGETATSYGSELKLGSIRWIGVNTKTLSGSGLSGELCVAL